MKDEHIELPLLLSNYILGTLIIGFSLYVYYYKKNTVPLYITLAIVIAGPIEDILVYLIKSTGHIPDYQKRKYILLIDQLTSLGFLFFLLLAIIESSR